MAFKAKKKASTTYENPEALFRDRRNRTVQGLLSHQSDILRRYQDEAFDKSDVALELPTGSGKTLVGLLIGEFRRVTRGERVLYLTPTRQLALQVCAQSAKKYGIIATPFIGRKRDYSPEDKHNYQSAQTIAVAPYSALFNSNPFFDKPQIIVLDDAHAAENYIASNWSLFVNRTDHEDIYYGLLSIVKELLPLTQQDRFLAKDSDEFGFKWIEKIPTIQLNPKLNEISAFLDVNTENSNLYFTWSLLSGNLDACHMYVSYDQILIRPYIPPSMTHTPFSYATQRVYMSATLGLGGDLERITGVPQFHRLPIPDGWDKQGIGRRYFIFPELSLSKVEIEPLIKRAVDKAHRALILVPSDVQVATYRHLFNDIPVYTASDIETSKDNFILEENAVAVLANRYDGIDLPDDECRLLIIDRLPKAGNLQELFLMSRMVAGNLFKDRIRTRIIQAFGRCTRSATDFAAVMVIGEDFFDWLIINENRSLFHPELQGELIFGAEQAEGLSSDEFIENLDIFLSHSTEWNEADADILEKRESVKQNPIPGQDLLFQTAALEVKYSYEMWNKNYEAAADLAQRVSNIIAGEDLKGLRGFWYYLAASACDLAALQLQDITFKPKAEELYSRAAKCLPAISQLRALAAGNQTVTDSPGDANDELLESNIEKIEMLFEKKSFGLPLKFESEVNKIIEGLRSNNSTEFEESHKNLGEMLGFDAGNSQGNAAPDPWWISHNLVCLVSEDKSDSTPGNPIPVKDARQAASHQKWIENNINLNEGHEVYTVLITRQSNIDKEVPTYADRVGWWHVNEFQSWAINAIGVLRRLRATYTGPGQESWRQSVRNELIANKLDPRSIIKTATENQLKDLEIVAKKKS